MEALTPEQKDYKRKQRERLNSYIVGQKDRVGDVITHIYVLGDEYVIYDYDNGDGRNILRVQLDTEIEEDPNNLCGNFDKIKKNFNEFKGVVHKADNQEFVKSVAAQAISLGIKGGLQSAELIFEDIITRINKEHSDSIKCKLAYLISCMTWLILTSVLGVLVYLFRTSEFITTNIGLLNAFFCCLFAGFGGFISVTRKLYKLIIEKDVKFSVYIIYGIERMIIANLSGLVAYVLIKCGIALSFVNDLSNPLYAYMAISIISGFSENYIPDLLVKIEKKQ